MPVVGTKANAGAFGLGWSAVLPGEELGGMVLLTPTSVDITGGGSETATIGANGSVEFSACATLSLNGVFSADYDNYMVGIRSSSSTTATYFRLRSSGTDESSASNYYTSQYLIVSSTSVLGGRSSQNYARIGANGGTLKSGDNVNIYGPYLAQPTAWRNTNVSASSGGYIEDWANTHSQSLSYDGFTFYPSSGTFDGLVSVYGLVGA